MLEQAPQRLVTDHVGRTQDRNRIRRLVGLGDEIVADTLVRAAKGLDCNQWQTGAEYGNPASTTGSTASF